MVNEDFLLLLNEKWREFAKNRGIGSVPAIENRWDNFCQCKIPKALGNAMRSELSDAIDDICGIEGVESVDDLMYDIVLRGDETRDVDIFVCGGKYTKTRADRVAKDLEADKFDPETEAYAAEQKRIEESRRRNYRDYIIDVPECPKKFNTEVYLPLAFEYYDQIEAGEKVTEFRKYTKNWVKRLLSHPIETVRFQRGYSDYGTGAVKQMTFRIKGVELYDSMTRRSCPADAIPEGFIPDFIAIDLGERLS